MLLTFTVAPVKKEVLHRALPSDVSGLVEKISGDAERDESVYLVVGPALAVDAILNHARAANHLRDATHTIIAL